MKSEDAKSELQKCGQQIFWMKHEILSRNSETPVILFGKAIILDCTIALKNLSDSIFILSEQKC